MENFSKCFLLDKFKLHKNDKVTKYLTPKVDSTMHGPTQHNGLVYFQINYYLVY